MLDEPFVKTSELLLIRRFNTLQVCMEIVLILDLKNLKMKNESSIIIILLWWFYPHIHITKIMNPEKVYSGALNACIREMCDTSTVKMSFPSLFMQ